MTIRFRLALAALTAVCAGPALAQDCPFPPDPVISLTFDSRYDANDTSRSEIDPEAADAAEDAIAPVDDFLRDLTEMANDAVGRGDAGLADCVLGQIAVWANADALSDLGNDTPALTIGSRYAGFALVLMQVVPLARQDAGPVLDWLQARMDTQRRFWEDEAPPGARDGNLRAWAALAGAATAELTGDVATRLWAAWGAAHVLCTAAPDGSLPQEMRRGRLALHYQMHALSPLAVTALILDRQGLPLTDVCDGALDRAAAFALADIAAEGALTEAITGTPQSFFDGSDEIEGFHLAWLTAYRHLGGTADPGPIAVQFGPPRYSKLGGDQDLIWRGF